MVGLDPHAIKQLKLVFEKLRESGASVLISTHMIDSVENYWDKAYIMEGGKLCAQKSANDADSKSLEDLFFEITEGKKE